METATGAYFALCENDIIARSGMGGQRMNSRRLLPPPPFLSRAVLPRLGWGTGKPLCMAAELVCCPN